MPSIEKKQNLKPRRQMNLPSVAWFCYDFFDDGNQDKKWSCNDRVIGATLFEAVKSHKMLVINRAFLPLQIASLPRLGRFSGVTFSPFAQNYPQNRKDAIAPTCYGYHLTENFLLWSPSAQPKQGAVPAKENTDFRILGGRRLRARFSARPKLSQISA